MSLIKICFRKDVLEVYQQHLQVTNMLSYYGSNNKLRDGNGKFVAEGHEFSWNGEILFSYDVCANCEAHALLLAYQVININAIYYHYYLSNLLLFRLLTYVLQYAEFILFYFKILIRLLSCSFLCFFVY